MSYPSTLRAALTVAIASGFALFAFPAPSHAQSDAPWDSRTREDPRARGDDLWGPPGSEAARDGRPAPARRGQAGDSGISLALGLGFTDDPDTALFGFDLLFDVSDHLSVGPLLQIGVEDDFTLISLTGNLRLGSSVAELAGRDAAWARRLGIYAQAGLGFSHIEPDGNGTRDDTEFMFNFGFGVEYAVGPKLSLGSSVLYNITPDAVFGEELVFSWQVLTTRVRF